MSNNSDLGIGVAAALAQRYQEDEREFLETLAVFMETSLPEATQIERSGPFWARQRPIIRLSITLGHARYVLQTEHGALQARIVRLANGISSRTECPSVTQWIDSLSNALQTRIGQSRKLREAIDKLLR